MSLQSLLEQEHQCLDTIPDGVFSNTDLDEKKFFITPDGLTQYPVRHGAVLSDRAYQSMSAFPLNTFNYNEGTCFDDTYAVPVEFNIAINDGVASFQKKEKILLSLDEYSDDLRAYLTEYFASLRKRFKKIAILYGAGVDATVMIGFAIAAGFSWGEITVITYLNRAGETDAAMQFNPTSMDTLRRLQEFVRAKGGNVIQFDLTHELLADIYNSDSFWDMQTYGTVLCARLFSSKDQCVVDGHSGNVIFLHAGGFLNIIANRNPQEYSKFVDISGTYMPLYIEPKLQIDLDFTSMNRKIHNQNVRYPYSFSPGETPARYFATRRIDFSNVSALDLGNVIIAKQFIEECCPHLIDFVVHSTPGDNDMIVGNTVPSSVIDARTIDLIQYRFHNYLLWDQYRDNIRQAYLENRLSMNDLLVVKSFRLVHQTYA